MKRSLILPTPVCLYPTRHSTRRQRASRAMSTYMPSYRHSALTWSRGTCLLTQRTPWCTQHHTVAAEHMRQGFPVWRALGILCAIWGHLAYLALGPQAPRTQLTIQWHPSVTPNMSPASLHLLSTGPCTVLSTESEFNSRVQQLP